jgi:nitrate/nitrite-specific signal transduction histidine kinase
MQGSIAYKLILLFFIYIFIFTISAYILKKYTKKIDDDLSSIIDYIEDINNKKYNSIIKVDNYLEFLQISIILKNIAKRLKQKTK